MRTIRVINLTPHEIVVVDRDVANETEVSDLNPKLVLPRCEKPARCFYHTDVEETVLINGTDTQLQLTHTEYNRVINLPYPAPFTIYVVSDIVARFMLGKRDDLYVVNGLVKKDGATIACKSLGRL